MTLSSGVVVRAWEHFTAVTFVKEGLGTTSRWMQTLTEVLSWYVHKLVMQTCIDANSFSMILQIEIASRYQSTIKTFSTIKFNLIFAKQIIDHASNDRKIPVNTAVISLHRNPLHIVFFTCSTCFLPPMARCWWRMWCAGSSTLSRVTWWWQSPFASDGSWWPSSTAISYDMSSCPLPVPAHYAILRYAEPTQPIQCKHGQHGGL